MSGDAHHARAKTSQTEIEALCRRVGAAVRRACPGWLASEAEDITQQVLAQLLALIRRSEGERSFSSIYLEKAAYGVTVDEIRRRCRRREVQLETESPAAERPSGEADPERRALASDLTRGIVDCLGGLVRSRRLAVTLYLQGCGVPDAARLLGWTRKRTENLVYRGLADLRACLRDKGLEP